MVVRRRHETQGAIIIFAGIKQRSLRIHLHHSQFRREILFLFHFHLFSIKGPEIPESRRLHPAILFLHHPTKDFD